MKKVIAILLAICLSVGLCACSSQQNSNLEIEAPSVKDSNSVSTPSENIDKPEAADDPVNVLSGEIAAITPFQHGRAIVKIANEANKNYCVNTRGEIIFEIDRDIIGPVNNSVIPTATIYSNHLIFFSDAYGMTYTAVCNSDGELFYGEDHGITQFFPFAAEDGYILTYSDIDRKNVEIGILNENFEWVVEPSSEFASYFTVYNRMGSVEYKDKTLYCMATDTAIDITTGNAEKYSYLDESIFFENKPENWKAESDGYYFYTNIGTIKKTMMLSLNSIRTVKSCITDCAGAGFVSGKAPVVLFEYGPTPSLNKYYFALIDASGNIVLDEIEAEADITYISISENYIYVGYKLKLAVYTIDGEFVAEANLTDSQYGTSFSISDDIIIFLRATMDENNNINRKYYCYTPELKQLFS